MPQTEVVMECQKVFADNRPSVGNQGASLSPEVENHALSQAQLQSYGYKTEFSGIPRLANSCPAESSILPHLDEQGNQFSSLEFPYNTNVLQLQNSSATETTSPANPQNAATLQSQNMGSSQGQPMAVQTPQACYINQTRTPKPSFPKSDCNYVVGTIWENARKCFGCEHEFLPASAPDHGAEWLLF